MTRRKFSLEFKIEAVGLVTDRSVSVAQAGAVLGAGGTALPQRLMPAAMSVISLIFRCWTACSVGVK